MARIIKGETELDEAIVDAALQLAAEKGWGGLALADIAARAHVPLPEVLDRFSSKSAILDAYVGRIDRAMVDGGCDLDESPRDRLFEVVMRRFDAMAGDRKALAAILRQSGTDPVAILCGGRRFLKSMSLLVETAGLDSSGLGGLARVNGIGVVYLYVLKNFVADESPDLARTMAALDKALRRLEQTASFIFRRSRTAAPVVATDLSKGETQT